MELTKKQAEVLLWTHEAICKYGEYARRCLKHPDEAEQFVDCLRDGEVPEDLMEWARECWSYYCRHWLPADDLPVVSSRPKTNDWRTAEDKLLEALGDVE